MDIYSLLNEDILLIVLGSMIVLLLALLVITVIILIKNKKLRDKYDQFMSGFYKDKNFEEIFDTLISQVKFQEKKSIELGRRIARLENNIKFAAQKISLIRYKAFENKGGDQSFSLSLLDQEDNGFILTSIYNDGLSSVYGKEIFGGKSEHRLSEEEIRVLEKARSFSSDNTIKEQSI